MSRGEYLERLYRVFPWAEDPSMAEGLRRYQDTVSEFKGILGHEWFKGLTGGRRELKVVDLCSGAGIGGVALARVLMDLGVRVSLTLVDLRRESLDKAAEFGWRELGFRPEVLIYDVLELDEAGFEAMFDVALMWGLTTPHFSPWEWVRVLANVSKLLVDDGLFMYDETDRTYVISYLVGYKDVLPELVEKDRVVLTIHKGREFKSGYFNRLALNLITMEREEMNVYFWDLASSATFTWVFFSDVDYIPARRPYLGVIIGRGPRRTPNLEISFKGRPTMLK